MQILIFSVLIIALIVFLIYKIKKNFTKKELISFISIIVLIIVASIYFNKQNKDMMPKAFKQYYLKHNNLDVLKLSISQQNVQVLSSSKSIYNFDYIISKDAREYVCQAKDIEVIKIEDEYIFNNFKETCKVK